jgi:hypothetical protein
LNWNKNYLGYFMNTNKLIQKLEENQNSEGVTFKGAKTNVSSLNKCVDLFSQIGSMRSRSEQEIYSLFSEAFSENPLKALKILFWVRDILNGAGERKVFRTIINNLGKAHSNILNKNIQYIPEFGRWDDLFILRGTSSWQTALTLISEQLQKDWQNFKANKPISLLSKWMPSVNTSSIQTRKLAEALWRELDFFTSAAHYRKFLAKLRAHIDIVEVKMCAQQWSQIEYEHVPSRATLLYRNAFRKHDLSRYLKYLEDVSSGKKTIKTKTLYPYDIIDIVLDAVRHTLYKRSRNKVQYDETLALQWKNLPNYVDPFNGLVVIDTSGSMFSSGYYGGKSSNISPISVAISLAIYIAERNAEPWKNCFLQFASKAKLQKISGSNIYEKVLSLNMNGYYGSTNLQSIFDLILKTAIDAHLQEEDMPKRLFIISDMEFDAACINNKLSNFEEIERKYSEAGYKKPDLVFWNVNAYGKNIPVKFDEVGTALISGCSPIILKAVISNEELNPLDIMNSVIEVERYSKISV